MNTIQQVRDYFDAVIEGRRRPFSLVDNCFAFSILERDKKTLQTFALIESNSFDDLERRLTTIARDAADIELYRSMKMLLDAAYQ